MKFGAFFPTRDMPADSAAIRDWAQAAESLGFDYIEVPDHVVGIDRAAVPEFSGPYDLGDSFHEVFATLGFIAGATTNVGLASGVLILPQRQTALVAKQAAQLDVLCGGRLRLGIGVGWNRQEYDVLGQPWNVRGRRQAEQVALMQRLWTEPAVDFDGEFDVVHGAGLNPMPIQRPIPVWFGGGAPATLRRAAKLGDGWIPLGVPGPDVEEHITTLRALLAENGRDMDAFGVEGWIRSNATRGTATGPDVWAEQGAQWRELGASHATFYTSGLGVGDVPSQIRAMEEFIHAVR